MLRTTSVRFDDRNLVSPAGSVPALALAERVGLRELAVEHLWLGQRSIRAAGGWRGGPRRPCRAGTGVVPQLVASCSMMCRPRPFSAISDGWRTTGGVVDSSRT